jgi:hypothetical protein
MTERAQAILIGFAVALVVVTTVTVAGATLASDALVDADRDPASVRAAESLAAHLVDEFIVDDGVHEVPVVVDGMLSVGVHRDHHICTVTFSDPEASLECAPLSLVQGMFHHDGARVLDAIRGTVG